MNVTDPFENMPLRLMMLVEVRPTALKNYDAMPEEQKKRADEAARRAKGRMEKERLIDRIECGETF
jgi:hypothetical protein